MRTYSELIQYDSFEDRFNYLKLGGQVGSETFGFDRYLNQALYRSLEWKRIRNEVITRDLGCDLGIEGYEINSGVIIHHMNPITIDQIQNRDPIIFDPEFLITTVLRTHNAIHYGDESIIKITFGTLERKRNDTKLW